MPAAFPGNSTTKLARSDGAGGFESAIEAVGGDPVSSFTAASGFSLSENGDGSFSVSDSQARLGTKYTQHPTLYDRIDAGIYVFGALINPYSPSVDGLVPAGAGTVFTSNQGGVAFKSPPSTLGSNRSYCYGAETAVGINRTLREPLAEGQLASPVAPIPYYFTTAFWAASFSTYPGGSVKYTRTRDTLGDAVVFATSMNVGSDSSGGAFPSGDHRTVVESGGAGSPSAGQSWYQLEQEWELSAGGFYKARRNNTLFREVTFSYIPAEWPGGIYSRQWGWDPSGDNDPGAGDFIYFTDFYSDYSRARIVLCDAATVASSTYSVPQMHTSWAVGAIDLTDIYAGPHGSISGKHLIAVKEDGSEIKLGEFV